jgi:carbonic anhydrase/acetyltransferase-like protein (isoleucine patch superfamily)
MRRIVVQDTTQIAPFNEPARELRVQNKPLWLWQRDLLAPYVTEEREYPNWPLAARIEGRQPGPLLVHRDNLYFNRALIDEFLRRARGSNRPVRLAFRRDDPAIREHVLPLSHSFEFYGDLILADMWYLPDSIEQRAQAQPLVIDCEARERGYYHVPPYMADDFGDLVYQLPIKAFAMIESWVHLFIVDILFGVFANGADTEDRINEDWRFKLKIMFNALLEQKQVLRCSELVQVGKNCNIDSSAVIHGPCIIGDNVTIGAGAVIDNCVIGSNVTVSQGCQLMLSVVGDGCFLPFRAALFMTTLMENTSVAQNTCLQLCIVGRDSFIGAGTTFTDFNVLPRPLRAYSRGKLMDANLYILGGCVGHHCRLTAGLTIYPARMVESDVVLQASSERHVITHNISYEESDHFQYGDRVQYPRLYPRRDEEAVQQGVG